MTFERAKVASIATFHNSKRKPVTKTDRKPGDIPYYGAAGIQDYVADYMFDGHFVLVGEDGTVLQPGGKPTLQNIQGKSWVNNHAHVLSSNDTDDTDFLFYSLGNEDITAFVTGAVQMKLNMGNLKDVEVYWPTEARCRSRIAQVLRQFDEKITLNFRISSQLEQIAQTIFKSWFIDFDPVHANARGEQPEGMDAETAALFPYSFDETELGLIPSGWGVSRFDSFAEIQLGGTPSKAKAEYWDGSIPWVNSGAINEFRITKPSRYITELGLRKSSCKVLPKGTTVVAITGATLGQFSRVEIDTTANQSVIGITPRNRSLNNFVYLWVTQNIEQLTSKATGGAQQHINRNDVCEQLVVLPSHEAFSKFDELVDPIFAIISSLVHQNDTLVEIRDSLLPRLISGELEIPEELLVD